MQNGPAGTLWTQEERDEFESESAAFLRKRSQDAAGSAQPLRKKARKETELPRLASLDVLRSWQSHYEGAIGKGLERWLEISADKIGLNPPPFLTLTMDWEQVQWCPAWFLRHKLRCYIEPIPDYEHVRNANLGHATDYSGERLVVAKAHVCNNIRRGPWNSKAWSSVLRQAAYCISANLHCNSPFLLYFWDGIVKGLGLGEEYRGESGRSRLLKELPALPLITRDPPTSSPQRWMSFEECSTWLDPYTEVERMLMCFYCLKKKIVSNIQQLIPQRGGANMDKEVKKIHAFPDKKSGMETPSSSTSAPVACALTPGTAETKAKPVTAAKCRASAKAKVKHDLNKSHNTLHQVTRYKMDDDFIYPVRRLCLISCAEVNAHSLYLSTAKSADDTQTFFAEQASGKHTKVFCDMLQCCFDLTKLAHCGLECDVRAAKDLEVSSPQVLWQDAQCHCMFKFEIGIMMNRSASLAWHDMCWPGLTALFVHAKTEMVARGVRLLRLDVSAMEWSKDQSPTGAEMAARSMLNGPVMAQIVKMFKADKFARVPPCLVEWFKLFWSGLLQSVINERANKVLRQVETHDCPSKAIARMKKWEALRLSSLAKMYERKPLEVAEFHDVPVDCLDLMSSLFEHSNETPPLNLHRITGVQDWQTWNSMTVRNAYAETFVMRQAYENTDASILTGSAMVPAGQVICVKPDVVRECYFTLQNLRIAFQVYLCSNKGHTVHLDRDPDTASVEWRCIKSWDDIYVIPTRSGSPLHSMIVKKKTPNVSIGAQLIVAGSPVKVLQWQLNNGFAGIREEELKLIKKHLNAKTTVLATDLIMHLEPKITEDEMTSRLHLRKLTDYGCPTGETELDQAIISDTMLASDRNNFMRAQEEETKVGAQRKERGTRITKLLEHIRPKLKKSKAPNLGLKTKIETQKRKHGEMWFMKILGDAAVIEEYKPTETVCIVDDSNGRFLMHHKSMPQTRRSISWTERGMLEANRESLQTLWSWECLRNGTTCPLPVAMTGELFT